MLNKGVEPTAPQLTQSLITATDSNIATRGSASVHVHNVTYEYIPDSELPTEENRAYNVHDGEIPMGENTAYGHNEVPATNLELNEAYNYRQPVPTPNIAYGGHNTEEHGHARQSAEDVYI